MLRDIDEEFAQHVMPSRGAAAARVWYWRQVSADPAGAGDAAAPKRLVRSRRARPAVCASRTAPASRCSVVAIATFALGIGANTAIFSIVDAVVFRPLPFVEPDQLVRIWSSNPRGIPRNAVSPADYIDFETQAVGPQGLTGLAAFTSGDTKQYEN